MLRRHRENCGGMTSATTRKVLKIMPPVGVKIKLVSKAGAAGMPPQFSLCLK